MHVDGWADLNTFGVWSLFLWSRAALEIANNFRVLTLWTGFRHSTPWFLKVKLWGGALRDPGWASHFSN